MYLTVFEQPGTSAGGGSPPCTPAAAHRISIRKQISPRTQFESGNPAPSTDVGVAAGAGVGGIVGPGADVGVAAWGIVGVGVGVEVRVGVAGICVGVGETRVGTRVGTSVGAGV